MGKDCRTDTGTEHTVGFGADARHGIALTSYGQGL
jgi:hypothetical protein